MSENTLEAVARQAATEELRDAVDDGRPASIQNLHNKVWERLQLRSASTHHEILSQYEWDGNELQDVVAERLANQYDDSDNSVDMSHAVQSAAEHVVFQRAAERLETVIDAE